MKTSLLVLALAFLSTSLLAQGRTIKDFYTQFKQNTPRILADHKPSDMQRWSSGGSNEELLDLKNGYAKFAVLDKESGQPDMECASFEMAVWKAADASLVIGVFPTYCGGEGCGGQLNNLRFFDTKWNDVTSRVLDKNTVLGVAKNSKFSNGYKPDAGFFNSEMECQVTIPRIGTNLTITPRMAGMEGTPIVLKFDKTLGKFIF